MRSLPTRIGASGQSARVAVAALVPFVGLVAGPVAILLGLAAWLRGNEQRAKGNMGPTHGAIFLGVLTTLTNWLGVALMWYGWTN